MSDEEKKAVEGLKWSQQQMRLGNLPDYDQGHYDDIRIVLNLIEKQSKEIEELKDFITKLQATKDRLDSYDKENTLEIEKLNKEIEELKKENLEIRDWKYVIDSPIDLDKLKELDLIKIKGKEYISKRIYNELEKDKKALVNNYSKVLGEFIPKDK